MSSFHLNPCHSGDLANKCKRSNLQQPTAVCSNRGATAARMANSSSRPQVNLRLVFRKYDENNDGFINFQQLYELLRSIIQDITEADLEEQIRKAGLDTGNKTAISYENFVHLARQIHDNTKRTRRLWHVFQEFDLEKKGYIDEKGIKHILTKLDIEHTDTDIKLMIETADSDGDGKVDYEDFLQMFTES